MRTQMLKSKFWVVPLVIVAFSMVSTPAFAWGGHDRGGFDRGRREAYHWRGGHWYRSGWFWGGAVVSALALGALVASLPPRYTVVRTGGLTYYYDGSYYYRACPGGYEVVPAPVVVVEPAPVVIAPVAAPNMVTINVPNARGGYTPVTLARRGNGYVGPQGEYYDGSPSVDQLRALYGN